MFECVDTQADARTDGWTDGRRLGSHPINPLVQVSLNREKLVTPFLSSFASDFHWCCLTSQGSPVTRQHVGSVESSSLNLLDTFRD